MKIAKYWLILGVTALGLSGLFTILLIIGRTSNSLPESFFAPSLIVHVNLDVLVWLLAITASHFNLQKTYHSLYPLIIGAFGTALITISPFIGTGEAYTNNYIPIFDNTLFKLGIAMFLGAIAYESITTLFSRADFKTRTLAFLLVTVFVAFGLSYISISEKTSSHYLYEYLFWGGGHIMQFAYVQVMLIAWLVMAEKLGITLPVSKKILNGIFLLPVIFVLLSTIFIYASTNVETTNHVELFTKQMIYGTAIAAFPVSILIFLSLALNFRLSLYHITLAFSLLLFAIGGALGQLAAKAVANGDITTIIPAHYHFSSVAVTVALMGYIFVRLDLHKTRLVSWTVALYSIGQISYFTGMAILGGHGAARKTPGIDLVQMDDATRKTVEHLMRSGGSLSLIGGILFVVIVIKAFRHQRILAKTD